VKFGVALQLVVLCGHLHPAVQCVAKMWIHLEDLVVMANQITGLEETCPTMYMQIESQG